MKTILILHKNYYYIHFEYIYFSFHYYQLIRNNGPYNLIFIGHSLFLPDDIMLYSDEGGVNTDYIYLTGTNLTNINRNGYYSITSMTSNLNFSLVFNMYSDKPIINLNNFDGLSFFLIVSIFFSVLNFYFD